MKTATSVREKEVGFVRSAKEYLLRVEGLPSARIHDVIVDNNGQRALVTGLTEEFVEVMALDAMDPKPGDEMFLTKRSQQFFLGTNLLGRAVNSLGDPIDKQGGFPVKNAGFAFDVEAEGISTRAAIDEQLETGFAVVDTVLPVAKGQRQLIMGQVRSGMDVFIRETILHQLGKNTVCIYASIGQPAGFVSEFASALLSSEARDYTVVVGASSEDPTPLITLAPSLAFTIAEFFRAQGNDVLLVLDDLYTHAKYLREVALLQGRLPGRESYPGDIFYQQAQYIERAGVFRDSKSITLFPLLQTDIEGETDLITTNIMGTTDGHLSFNAGLYAEGVFPPIVIGESVTRVGKYAQSMVQRQLSTRAATLLADTDAQERYTHFGANVSEDTEQLLEHGRSLRYLLSQETGRRLSVPAQSLMIGLLFSEYAEGKSASFFRKNRDVLTEAFETSDDFADLRDFVHTAPDMNTFCKKISDRTKTLDTVCRQ